MPRIPLTAAEKQLPYADFYDRAPAPIPQAVTDQVNKVHRSQDALAFENLNDLLLPGDLAMEIGHCRKPDGSFFVAMKTPLPGVTKDMLNWWFDWHPKESLRYRIWFPEAHYSIRFKDKADHQRTQGALPHWHTTHYPIEDIGIGKDEISIRFLPPAEFGFDTTLFEAGRVETIICGLVGAESRRAKQVVRMCHVVRRTSEGLEMRSRFWMGDNIEFEPFFGSQFLEKLANTGFMRRKLMPARTGYAMALHCAQEYRNLAQILPELYARFAS